MAACSTPPAPVVERSSEISNTAPVADGLYRIRRGDTLHAIAFRFGLDHRDLARWNRIGPPYLIYPDQVLKLAGSPASVPESRAPDPGKPANKPVAKPPPVKTVASKPPVKPASKPAVTVSGDPKSWVWPVDGRILRSFLANDPARNGLDITAPEGQEVKASAAGTVVYSGNGLIGFGELIIIKHSERMLSAYAHNRRRLVFEGASVTKGQKIAELGHNDRNEAILHFEIRVNGKPVDPRKYLPAK